MKRKISILLIISCMISAIAGASDCIPLELNDHYSRHGRGIPAPSTEDELRENCEAYVKLQNSLVRQGIYEGSYFEYKHFWCLDEYEVRENPVSGTLMYWYYYGVVTNYDMEELMLGLMDSLIIPAFDYGLKAGANAGESPCDPYCMSDTGINPYVANFFHEEMVMSIPVTNFSMSYNSIDQTWSSSLDIGFEALDDPDYQDEVAELRLPDGKIVPIVKSQDQFICSSIGAKIWQDRITDEFIAELLSRVYTFLPDGKVKELFIRDINESINFDYSENKVVVSRGNGELGYEAEINGIGKPETITSLNSAEPIVASLEWAADGRLLSTTINDGTRSFLYEDENNTKLLTGIINEKGNRESSFVYDAQGRIVQRYDINSSGQHVNNIEIDYSNANAIEPSIKVMDPSGLVTEKFYQEYFGVYKTTKIIQHIQEEEPIILVVRKYNRLGHLLESTDALGVKTEYQRDGFGRILKETKAKGTNEEITILTTWDSKCSKPKEISLRSEKTINTYDTACRLISTSVSSI